MAGFIDAAVQDIDNRLLELKAEEAKLTAARAALAGGATTTTTAGPKFRVQLPVDGLFSAPTGAKIRASH